MNDSRYAHIIQINKVQCSRICLHVYDCMCTHMQIAKNACVCVCTCWFHCTYLCIHMYVSLIIACPAVSFPPLWIDCCCFPWSPWRAVIRRTSSRITTRPMKAIARPLLGCSQQGSSAFQDSWRWMMIMVCFFWAILWNSEETTPPTLHQLARGTSRECLVERWSFSTGLHGRPRGKESSQRDAYAHAVDRKKHSYVMARGRGRSCKRKCIHCSAKSGLFHF